MSYTPNKTVSQIEFDRILGQLRSYKTYGFLGDVNDPIYMEAMRIENIGFEEAHKLRTCGHSRGDYRDPKYGTAEYAGDEQCVACSQIERLTQPVSDGEWNSIWHSSARDFADKLIQSRFKAAE